MFVFPQSPDFAEDASALPISKDASSYMGMKYWKGV
jgi:hypothetical protein